MKHPPSSSALPLVAIAAIAASAIATAIPRHAMACGGCFSPPQTVQTVTYHRMALAASSTQTTLWDQFGYSGRPDEFSWILPIQGGPDVRVELADVRFLAALDDASRATIPGVPGAPRRMCPSCYTPPPDYAYGCTDRSPSASRDAAAYTSSDTGGTDASADTSVTVLRESVVGPYAVVVLRGSDAGALRTWLTSNAYAVPPSMEPVIDHYIAMHTDFVALRLRDGVGLGQMQPVRVTAPGYQPFLPLRMVAAGVADRVELVLMTISDSRLEPSNFPSTQIGSDLAWDFGNDVTPIGAFRRAERELRDANGGRSWLTESAVTRPMFAYETIASQAANRYIGESPTLSPTQDMRVALVGMGQSPVLTRLHADLSVTALDRDLMLSASARGERSPTYEFGRTLNTRTPAACPALQCSTGLVIGGEGEIVDPFYTYLAPGTVLPSTYVRGSVPAYVPRYLNYGPRYVDGRPYTPPAPRYAGCGPFGCSVQFVGAPRRSAEALAIAIAVGGVAVSLARRRRRSQRPV